MDKVKIEKMTAAGIILGEVLEEVMDAIEPGISEIELDALAEKLILQSGGKPGFKKVPGYRHTICISTNDVVVHGIPTKRIIREGDIVGVDCGVFLDGYHTDMAETKWVKGPENSVTIPRTEQISSLGNDLSAKRKGDSKNEKLDIFLETGKKAMFAGIRQAKVSNRVGHISGAVQEIVEGRGFSVVRSLVGHGVGKKLHEKPDIPGYLSSSIEKTPLLVPGMTIAVEVIYNMGGPEVSYTEGDDWTIVSSDESLSGLFERTILVTEEGPKILTSLKTDNSWLKG